MAKSKTGHAIRRARLRPAQLKQLDELIVDAQVKNDLGEGEIAADFGVTRGLVNRWLQWYGADHVEGLRTTIA